MESNWRWNVFEIGASGDIYTLLARVIGITQPTYVGRRIMNDGYYSLVTVNFLPSDSPYSSTTVPIPTSHPHFPYGIDVLPDHL